MVEHKEIGVFDFLLCFLGYRNVIRKGDHTKNYIADGTALLMLLVWNGACGKSLNENMCVVCKSSCRLLSTQFLNLGVLLHQLSLQEGNSLGQFLNLVSQLNVTRKEKRISLFQNKIERRVFPPFLLSLKQIVSKCHSP